MYGEHILRVQDRGRDQEENIEVIHMGCEGDLDKENGNR